MSPASGCASKNRLFLAFNLNSGLRHNPDIFLSPPTRGDPFETKLSHLLNDIYKKIMKLLLHTCCAPCLIYPLERLKENGFEVSGFFYNPNIQPFAEYKNRRQAIEELSKKFGISVIYPEYAPSEYFQTINLKEKNPGRCPICWAFRLRATAKEAQEKGFHSFSTTLLASPYQDQALLKKIGDAVSESEGIDFYYEDFRTGFSKAHTIAKAEGIYCQKYCGCIYSEIERCNKSAKP